MSTRNSLITAADAQQPIRATFAGGITIEAEEGSGERRILAGVAVPWGEVGYTNVGPVKFLEGSLDPGQRPYVDRDHDETRLVGVVASATTDAAGLHAKVKVSRVPEGDTALALAEDGALTGFSVVAQPVEFSYEDTDEHGLVMVVSAGQWVALSLVPRPAFATARIKQVAASAESHNRKDPSVNLKQLIALLQAADASKRGELLAEHSEVVKASGLTVADVTSMVEAGAKVEVLETSTDPTIAAAVEAMRAVGEKIEAGISKIVERPVEVPLSGAKAEPHQFVNAGDYAMHAARAARRDNAAMAEASTALITAALTTTATGDNLGIVPPSYTSELLGNLPVATPVLDVAVRRSPLPATGMSIIKPEWDDLPVVATVSTENTQAPTGAVGIDAKTVAVLIAAHAVRASISLIERSDFGGFAQAYYEACGISYLSWLEAKALDTMITAAQPAPASGSTAGAQIMSVFVEAIENQKGADDNLRGYVPDFAGVGSAVFADLAEQVGPAFATASRVNVPTLNGNYGGLQVYLFPALDPDAILVGARAATVVQAEGAMQLRSMIVETLSVELGVIAHAAFDVEYPLALAYSDGGS